MVRDPPCHPDRSPGAATLPGCELREVSVETTGDPCGRTCAKGSRHCGSCRSAGLWITRLGGRSATCSTLRRWPHCGTRHVSLCRCLRDPAASRVPAPAALHVGGSVSLRSDIRGGIQEQRAAHEELAPQRETERHHRNAQVHHTALWELDTELLLRRLLEPTAGIEEDRLRRPHRQLASAALVTASVPRASRSRGATGPPSPTGRPGCRRALRRGSARWRPGCW